MALSAKRQEKREVVGVDITHLQTKIIIKEIETDNVNVKKNLNFVCVCVYFIANLLSNFHFSSILMFDIFKVKMDLCQPNGENFIFNTLITIMIIYGCNVWGCSLFRETWRKIEQIHKCFIIHTLKIKGNTLIESYF